MTSRRNRINYDNMSPKLDGGPAYITKTDIFGAVFN